MKIETLNLATRNGPTTAHVARPDTEATAGIIVIQEWWGLNDHIRDVAGRYARAGYLCVAPDLYRGRLAADPQEAAALMNALPLADGIETVRETIAAAGETYSVSRFGITGFCMGGTFSLRAACEIPALAAAAPFYGDVPEEEVLCTLAVPTLFVAGTRDAWINPAKVNGLKETVSRYNLPLEVVSYDADHAFFNDTRPQVYDADAAADAWQRVLAHFRKHLLHQAASSV